MPLPPMMGLVLKKMAQHILSPLPLDAVAAVKINHPHQRLGIQIFT